MKAHEYGESFEKRPARTTFRVLVIGFFIIAGLSALGWTFGFITLPFRSASGVAERTLAPDNVIYNYEWFKRQYNEVQAIDVQLAAAEEAKANFEQSAGSRENWKMDDRTEWNRLNSVVLGLRGNRARMVADYNARASMVNRNIFMAGDVPDRIK
jgi:hypothetical protein